MGLIEDPEADLPRRESKLRGVNWVTLPSHGGSSYPDVGVTDVAPILFGCFAR